MVFITPAISQCQAQIMLVRRTSLRGIRVENEEFLAGN